MIANYNFYNNTPAKENKTNQVCIAGVWTGAEFSHTHRGENYYQSFLFCQRDSRVLDIVPIIFSENTFGGLEQDFCDHVQVTGEIRTFYVDHKLKLYIHATSIEKMALDISDVNSIDIEGALCKRPIFRSTPLGRMISDICVAVKRPYGKYDYIPCITWGRAAQEVSKYEVGDYVKINGRFQSRDYHKDGQTQTVYEVSVRNIEKKNN